MKAMKLAKNFTPEDKDEIIELVYSGHGRDEAARQIGSSGTQIRRLCNPRYTYYDEDFAKRYEEARGSEEHTREKQERIRDELDRVAFGGNTRILEKMAYQLLPEWEVHPNFRVSVSNEIKVLQATAPHLTDDQLREIADRRRAELEQPPTLHALPSGE